MKQQILNTALAAAFAASLLAGCTTKNENQTGTDTSATTNSAATQVAAPSVQQGKYLVTAVGCNDCHTPWKMGPQGPAPDMTMMLSGHPAALKIDRPAMLMPPWGWAGDMTMTAFSGPWGVSFAANLTPDSATGIGTWSQDDFVKTLRMGQQKGTGRAILPPMPWQDFKNMTDADLSSIYLYLLSIPKISNKVPDPIMPQAGMAGMPPGGMPPGGMPGMPPPGAPPMHPHRHK